MQHVISVELSRRSFYLFIGPLEIYGELLMKDWPKQWSRLSEPGSFELWMGRAYFCLARMQRPRADATLRIEPLSGEAKPRECQVLPFKAPARVA